MSIVLGTRNPELGTMIKTLYHRMFNGVHRKNGFASEPVDWSRLPRDIDPVLQYQKLLGPRAMKVIRAYANAMFDDGKGGPSKERLDWFEREINDFFGSAGGASTLILAVAPWILELAPVLTLSHLALLTQLERPQQQKCLEHLEHSPVAPFALVALLVKALVCLVFLEHPDALEEIGFDGECMMGKRPDMPMTTVFTV